MNSEITTLSVSTEIPNVVLAKAALSAAYSCGECDGGGLTLHGCADYERRKKHLLGAHCSECDGYTFFSKDGVAIKPNRIEERLAAAIIRKEALTTNQLYYLLTKREGYEPSKDLRDSVEVFMELAPGSSAIAPRECGGWLHVIMVSRYRCVLEESPGFR